MTVIMTTPAYYIYASMTCSHTSSDDITEIDMPVKNNNYNVYTE